MWLLVGGSVKNCMIADLSILVWLLVVVVVVDLSRIHDRKFHLCGCLY